MIRTFNQENQKVIHEIVATVNTIKLYTLGHPQIDIFVDKLYETIQLIFFTESELTILIIDGEVVVNSRLLPDLGTVSRNFVELLSKKGIERLTFIRGVTREELLAVFKEMVSPEVKEFGKYDRIRLGKLAIEDWDKEYIREDAAIDYDRIFEKSTLDLKSLYANIQFTKQLTKTDEKEARFLAVNFIKTFNQISNPMGYLASIKTEDEYTFVHTTNVALLTMKLADSLGFTGQHLVDITLAALMHDIGKMTISSEILNKKGSLDDDEIAIIQSHPVRGAQYISKQNEMNKLTMLVALEHHIRYDGAGYPNLGERWKTNIVSQMVSVCDVYDALRSNRPYRGPMSHHEIREILIKDSGTVFNPILVTKFLAMIEKNIHLHK